MKRCRRTVRKLLTFTQSEAQKLARIKDGKPGSPCPKGHLVTNTEFTKKPICTASKTYQRRKLEQLDGLGLDTAEHERQVDRVVRKVCLCEDLAAGALLLNDIDNSRPRATAVCPGPNLAYFSKISTLSEMVSHIYGRINLLNDTKRSNMFLNELKMYIEYLGKEITKVVPTPTPREIKYLQKFRQNLIDGIEYYKGLIPKIMEESIKVRETMKSDLSDLIEDLDTLVHSYQPIFTPAEAS